MPAPVPEPFTALALYWKVMFVMAWPTRRSAPSTLGVSEAPLPRWRWTRQADLILLNGPPGVHCAKISGLDHHHHEECQ